jgi:hypothetical protein
MGFISMILPFHLCVKLYGAGITLEYAKGLYKGSDSR